MYFYHVEPPDYENYDYLSEWKGREIQNLAERKLIIKLAGHPKRTLELGGGFGRITSVLERISEETYMVDYSTRNLAEAKKRLTRTNLVQCNFFNLPFSSRFFDLIVMIRVMHHIQNPTLLYNEICRVGQKGATVVVSVPYSPLSKIREMKEIEEIEHVNGHHRVFAGPIERYLDQRFKLEGIFGTGLFDNRIGRKFNKMSFLSEIDLLAARLWKLKNNLFLKLKLAE